MFTTLPAMPIPASGLDNRIRLALQSSDSVYSQRALADKLGISRQAINDIIAGRKPGLKHLKRIAEILEVDEHWLINGGTMPVAMNAIAQDDGGLSEDRKYYEDTMKEGAMKWRLLFHSDPRRAAELVAQLPPDVGSRINSSNLESVPWTYEDTIALLEPWELPEVPKRVTFRRGYHLARIVSAETLKPTQRDIPYGNSVFSVIRTALRLSRDHLVAFGGNADAINQALRELWTKQIHDLARQGVSADMMTQLQDDLGTRTADQLLASLRVETLSSGEAEASWDEWMNAPTPPISNSPARSGLNLNNQEEAP